MEARSVSQVRSSAGEPRARRTWKRGTAVGVLAALIAASLLVQSRRPPETNVPSSSGRKKLQTPEACIAAAIAAEKSGDFRAYVNCFTGESQAKLQSRAKTKTEEMANELRRGSADLTGFSISEIRFSDSSAGVKSGAPVVKSATLVVQRIFRQFDERQRVRLLEIDGNWQIVQITPLDRVTPPVPYGTPVVHQVEAAQ
jgi:hypothetical protein